MPQQYATIEIETRIRRQWIIRAVVPVAAWREAVSPGMGIAVLNAAARLVRAEWKQTTARTWRPIGPMRFHREDDDDGGCEITASSPAIPAIEVAP